MRNFKTLAIVAALSCSVAACQTTSSTATPGSVVQPNGKIVPTHYGYPDIKFDQQKTDFVFYLRNGVFIPPKPNGAGVAVLGPCTGIQASNEGDIRELAQIFLDRGYTVAVPDYNTAPRPHNRPFNCGKDKNLSDMRLVKDVYDATAALARAGVDPDRIFTVGQSLGAQIGADAIKSSNVELATRQGWGPVPRAVIGLYGGCAYPSRTYLDSSVVRPVLWMAGKKDSFAYSQYGCNSWTESSIMKKQPDSKFIVYENATHCWDCKRRHGYVNHKEGQTYLYNETATTQSRDEIFKFMEKFK